MQLSANDPSDPSHDLPRSVLGNAINVTAIAAPLVSVLIALTEYLEGEINSEVLLLSLYPFLFPLLWLCRNRMPHTSLAIAYLGLMLVMLFIIQLRGGLTFSHASLQLWVLLLAGLIFGVRGVIAALAVNLLAFTVAGYAVLNSWVPPINPEIWNQNSAGVWIRSAVILSLFGGTAAVAVAATVSRLGRETRRLRESLAREQEQRAALERAELEKENAIKALAESQRVEALGRLASGVAHDFNNSLTVITSSAEIAQLEPDLPDRASTALSAIKRASLQAADITRSLLAFGQKQPARLEIVDVGEMLSSMSESLGRLLPEDIEFSISEHTQAAVEIDRTQLERALLNLVINARDSIQQAGAITIGCRSEVIAEDVEDLPQGKYVVIWVADDGAGMTREVQERIFEPFYTTKAVGKGTGMGMALVHSLIKEACGDIKIESEPGGGTTISLYIPQTEAEISSNPVFESKGSEPTDSYSGYSILVVEDNPDVLATTSDTLTNAGFSVLEAADGDAALQLLVNEQHAFDLLCIDGVIPGASSAKVIESVQEKYPNARIVVCSGYVEEELVLRGIRIGELAYVRKPYLSGELLGCIRQELGIN